MCNSFLHFESHPKFIQRELFTVLSMYFVFNFGFSGIIFSKLFSPSHLFSFLYSRKFASVPVFPLSFHFPLNCFIHSPSTLQEFDCKPHQTPPTPTRPPFPQVSPSKVNKPLLQNDHVHSGFRSFLKTPPPYTQRPLPTLYKTLVGSSPRVTHDVLLGGYTIKTSFLFLFLFSPLFFSASLLPFTFFLLSPYSRSFIQLMSYNLLINLINTTWRHPKFKVQ